MPQGLLQVNRLVTSQNLFCTTSCAINRTNYHLSKILPVTLHGLKILRTNFFAR